MVGVIAQSDGRGGTYKDAESIDDESIIVVKRYVLRCVHICCVIC